MHRRGVRQFIKFGIVGASGTLVNFLVAHALEKTTALSWFVDFAIGFMVGGISNYIFNRIWTFGSRRNPFVEGLQFLTVSAVALLAGGAIFESPNVSISITSRQRGSSLPSRARL